MPLLKDKNDSITGATDGTLIGNEGDSLKVVEKRLDGPSVYGAITVTTTPSIVRVGGSNLTDRVVVSVQPTTGIIYYGFDNSVSSSTGTILFRRQLLFLEVGPGQDLYVVAGAGSVNTRIAEYK